MHDFKQLSPFHFKRSLPAWSCGSCFPVLSHHHPFLFAFRTPTTYRLNRTPSKTPKYLDDIQIWNISKSLWESASNKSMTWYAKIKEGLILVWSEVIALLESRNQTRNLGFNFHLKTKPTKPNLFLNSTWFFCSGFGNVSCLRLKVWPTGPGAAPGQLHQTEK